MIKEKVNDGVREYINQGYLDDEIYLSYRITYAKKDIPEALELLVQKYKQFVSEFRIDRCEIYGNNAEIYMLRKPSEEEKSLVKAKEQEYIGNEIKDINRRAKKLGYKLVKNV